MKELPEIVLVSTSPYRRALMERLGIPFRFRAPELDEEAEKDLSLAPEALATQLALDKALSVVKHEPSAILIASDQLVAFQGEIYGKPHTAHNAVRQLMLFSGREHELITAVAFHHQGKIAWHVDTTTMRFRHYAREEAERYVAADLPLDCAGSYKLESRGILLVDKIFSDDQTAIVGLPLIAVAKFLREFGFPCP